MNEPPVSDETKTALENSVNWFLADKLQSGSVTIATKKYLTGDNQLVYLTRCNVSETTVPRIKVQVLQRVSGGVNETGYQLYNDHRLEKYQNSMIFGQQSASSPEDTTGLAVSQSEGEALLALVNGLQSARQTI